MSESNEKSLSFDEVLRHVDWQVREINFRWKVYTQLYTEETKMLRFNTAGDFFAICENAFWDSILVRIRALFDKSYYEFEDTSQANSSLPHLIELIPEASHRQRLDEALKSIKKKFKRVFVLVSKTIAHHDHNVTSGKWPSVNRNDFEEGMNETVALVNTIESLSGKPQTMFSQPALRGDGRSLVTVLKRYSEASERMHRGQFLGPITYYQNHSKKLDEAIAEIHGVPVAVIEARHGYLATDPLLQILYQVYGITKEEILNPS
jgi:hypothetical protein